MNEKEVLDISQLSDEDMRAAQDKILDSLSEMPSIYFDRKEIKMEQFVPHIASYLLEKRRNLIKKENLSKTEQREKKKDVWWIMNLYEDKSNSSLEANKELFVRLKKNIFNKENFKYNIQRNKIAILFYERGELTDSDILLFIEEDKRQRGVLDFSRNKNNYIDHTFYINHVDFFYYLLNNTNGERLVNVLKEQNFAEYKDNFLLALQRGIQNDLLKYSLHETFAHLKKEKIFSGIFSDNFCIELTQAAPLTIGFIKKSIIKKIAKDKDLVKKICDEVSVVNEFFTQEQLNFIDDIETIKKITRYAPEWINNSYSSIWLQEEVIANYLLGYSHFSYRQVVNEVEYFVKINPNIDRPEFISHLLDEKIKEKKDNHNRLESFLLILGSSLLGKHIKKWENAELYEKICVVEQRKLESERSSGKYSTQAKLTIPVPLSFLSHVDYCINLEKKFPLLELDKSFKEYLIHSRKYSLHYLEKIVKSCNSQRLERLRSYLPEKMYSFFKQAGIEDKVLDFIIPYFEKKELEQVLNPKIAIVNCEELDMKITIKELPSEIINEKKKVIKL